MSRPDRSGSTLAAAVVLALTIGGLANAQTSVPTNSLPNPYRAIEGWAKMPEGRICRLMFARRSI